MYKSQVQYEDKGNSIKNDMEGLRHVSGLDGDSSRLSNTFDRGSPMKEMRRMTEHRTKPGERKPTSSRESDDLIIQRPESREGRKSLKSSFKGSKPANRGVRINFNETPDEQKLETFSPNSDTEQSPDSDAVEF